MQSQSLTDSTRHLLSTLALGPNRDRDRVPRQLALPVAVLSGNVARGLGSEGMAGSHNEASLPRACAQTQLARSLSNLFPVGYQLLSWPW